MSAESSGAQRRDDGTAAVLDADLAGHRGYAAIVREAIAALADTGEVFTPDDVARRCAELAPDHPGPHRAQLIGAVFNGAVQSGLVEVVGHERSRRRNRNRGHQNRYQGTLDPRIVGARLILAGDPAVSNAETARRTGLSVHRVATIRRSLGLPPARHRKQLDDAPRTAKHQRAAESTTSTHKEN
ncbi:hypothetical protein MYK68_18635 [Gordonia sp. PP30]|uniref:hypothetical protein n=1 Tax=Gordonia sp. PP30 TaxID=2935861 RepID=UPI001FFF955D|nr:hypothetical protein [Gordonia sp. PP30]UQE74702.1 hypothetical protein MYK68_18635 [Gordonia sp. PP30]